MDFQSSINRLCVTFHIAIFSPYCCLYCLYEQSSAHISFSLRFAVIMDKLKHKVSLLPIKEIKYYTCFLNTSWSGIVLNYCINNIFFYIKNTFCVACLIFILYICVISSMQIFELKQLNVLPFCILQMFFYFQLGHWFHSII